MQAVDNGARGVKRAVKVEENVSSVPLKKSRQNKIKEETSRKSLKSDGTSPSPNHYRILPDIQKEPQPTSSGFSKTSSLSTTNLPSSNAQFATRTPSEVAASPPYAYFIWNSQALPVPITAPLSRPREKEKTGLKMKLQREAQRQTSLASTSASVPTSFATASVVNTPTTAHVQGQVHSQASPPSALHQRLEVQLELRHATLLEHINARYTCILDDDRRRRAAYQEAAFQRAMEIDVEERWGRELSHIIGLTSPPLAASTSGPSSAAPALPSASAFGSMSASLPSHDARRYQDLHVQPHAAHTYSYTELDRDRQYLQLLIANTNMHISALRDAHRVAYEREATEAQFSARALRELDVRRDSLVLRRAQETRCAAGDQAVSEFGSVSTTKTSCTKVDCLGCSKDECVSDAVAAVRERVAEVARRVNALNKA